MSEDNKDVCQVHKYFAEDIQEIKKDVKALLAFKNYIFGAIGVISFLTTIIMEAIKTKF